LDADGALPVFKFGVFAGAFVLADDALGGDKFGDHDVGAELFADGTEGDIGDYNGFFLEEHHREAKKAASRGESRGRRSIFP